MDSSGKGMDSHTPKTPINILIVDDSEAIRIVMDAILQDLSIGDIHTCSSGETTLKSIQSRPSYFDLIFVDLNMPNMDGMELIRHLGEQKFQGGIVIASGMDTRIINLAFEIAKQNRVHLIGSLHKPITSEKIKTSLEKYNQLKNKKNTHKRVLTAQEISDAIDNELLIPYYQPKVDIHSHKLIGIELLARIDAPGHGGTLSPASFIHIAESHQLINKLTYGLLHKSIAEFQEIKNHHPGDYSLAFNLSPLQLEDLDTPKVLDEFIAHFNLSPADFVIEVTEEKALDSNNQLETLNRLRMNGYGVALDDFGTGFTNIHQLLSLPFSEVKIDQSLITNIHKDDFSQVIVQTLLELTQKLEIDLIAEGIESYEELNYLENLSQNIFLQGFIISKPKPKDSFLRWLHSWEKSHQST